MGTSKDSSRFAPGEVLRGKYRIKRVLGEGGMGVVVRATHLRLDQDVAIKMLRDVNEASTAASRKTVVERFAREARAAARLKGEHAVRILDVDDDGDDEPFLVMEYLEGSDLDRLVKKHGPLDVDRAVDYALQICEGLAEAHAIGIVHRDIKPANCFLAKTPRGGEIIKILDFGISKSESSGRKDPTITEHERILGSPAFMSPEQLKSARDVDARTDVWSLGVALYFLLSGRLPFEGDDATAVAARIASEDPKPLGDNVPEALQTIILERCLSKSLKGDSARLASVAELARELAPFTSTGDFAAKRVASVLRMPVAGDLSSPSSSSSIVTGRAAGPMTASLESPIVNALDGDHKLTASLDAPGPVSLGIIDDDDEREKKKTAKPVTRATSTNTKLWVGAAILVVCGIAWFATQRQQQDGSPSSSSSSSTTPDTRPSLPTATAAASTAAETAPPPPTNDTASATLTQPMPRDAGRIAIPTATTPATAPSSRTKPSPSDDPLKLDIK